MLHPDFYTMAGEDKQQQVLEQASFNNEAYETLYDPDKRMRYVLTLYQALEEEGQNQIPQDFLMEMMEVNESLMELEFDYNQDVLERLNSRLAEMEHALYQEVQPHLERFDGTHETEPELLFAKEYYLKKRYLLRIKENLSKFAVR